MFIKAWNALGNNITMERYGDVPMNKKQDYESVEESGQKVKNTRFKYHKQQAARIKLIFAA